MYSLFGKTWLSPNREYICLLYSFFKLILYICILCHATDVSAQAVCWPANAWAERSASLRPC